MKTLIRKNLQKEPWKEPGQLDGSSTSRIPESAEVELQSSLLVEVAGCVELGDDEFANLGYSPLQRPVRHASKTHPIPASKSKTFNPLEEEEAGVGIPNGPAVTYNELQLSRIYLSVYDEILEKHGGALPPDTTNIEFRGYPLDTTDINFLRKVWEDKGYGVDCIPHQSFSSPFVPVRIKDQDLPDLHKAMKVAQFAITQINLHTWNKYKKMYTLVEVKDVVWTIIPSYYLTFTAKEEDGDRGCGMETFRAMVYYPPWSRRLMEFKRLLDDDTWELTVIPPVKDSP